MGNCCIKNNNTMTLKEENKYLIQKLLEKDEIIGDLTLKNEISRSQNILIRAYYKNIENIKG